MKTKKSKNENFAMVCFTVGGICLLLLILSMPSEVYYVGVGVIKDPDPPIWWTIPLLLGAVLGIGKGLSFYA